jgi:hypothetical protein
MSSSSPGGAGYGSFLIDGWCLVRCQFGTRWQGRAMTSTTAEALTCLEAIRFLAGHVDKPGHYELVLFTDCKATVGLLKRGPRRAKDKRMAGLKQEWDGLAGLFGGVEIRWTPRDKIVRTLGH